MSPDDMPSGFSDVVDWSAMLRERRDWSILQHPINVQVDALVVEAEQVFDLRALGNWRRITPHDVLDELVAHPSRPVARHSFIRTARDRLGGLEQIHAHVQLRNVITCRQSSLEEEMGRRVSPIVTPSISTRTCLE